MEEITKKEENVLANFSTDITELARLNLLDPVIGREKEVNRIAQILSRRRKNNPIILGAPGVGKSALVDKLAQMIVDGTCPANLLDKKILSLEMSSIVSGTKYRGQFEERMKAIITELKRRDDVIIFIDEIHTMVGAGGSAGALDAANILKPALSRGNIQCIGATTFDEYKTTIEKDGALERRFQKVFVEQPTTEETRSILENLKERYEEFHNVKYTSSALDLCVKLSERFIFDRSFPDKAIDIMDEAGSSTQISKALPEKIKKLNESLKEVIELKQSSVKAQDFEEAVVFRNEETKIKAQIQTEKDLWREKTAYNIIEVNDDIIRKVISMISNIPFEKVSVNDAKKYLSLETIMKKEIIGQDEALTSLSKTLRRNKTGLSNPNKPQGVFLLLGKSGTGKTLTAKIISEEIFGPNSLVRIDMSEYSDKINISKLMGGTTGYVGYENSSVFEIVKQKPFSVILLDEIEKAHPDIFNILLPILDEGRFTDNQGRFINFKNTIIIMTSSVGIKNAVAMGKGVGFNTSFSVKEDEAIKNSIKKSMKDKFPPEFLNRITDIVTYNELSKDNIKEVVKIQLNKLKKRVSDLNYKLDWNNSVVDYITKETYEPDFGARPVERGIQKLVEDLISEELLKEENLEYTKIKIKHNKKDDKLSVSFE